MQGVTEAMWAGYGAVSRQAAYGVHEQEGMAAGFGVATAVQF